MPPYYNDPIYIEALVSSLREEMSQMSFELDVLLASFHGIPRDYACKGDPYPEQCAETVRLMREKLGVDEDNFMMTFQSRFGRTEWLQPYTDVTVKELAKSGVKNLAIITPGFSADSAGDVWVMSSGPTGGVRKLSSLDKNSTALVTPSAPTPASAAYSDFLLNVFMVFDDSFVSRFKVITLKLNSGQILYQLASYDNQFPAASDASCVVFATYPFSRCPALRTKRSLFR